MINLRYHIVSITAVFLALGIGIAVGSTFLDRVTVDNLHNQLTQVERQVRSTGDENARLRDTVSNFQKRESDLAAQLPEQLLSGHLVGVPVLVLATKGTDEALVGSAITALGSAGAQVAGTWWLTDKWALDSGGDVTQLDTILGLTTHDVDRLRRNSAIRLAALLDAASTQPTDPSVSTSPPPTEPPFVKQLVDAGFIDYKAAPGAGDARVLVPGFAARYVVVSSARSAEGQQAFATALLDELSADAPAPAVAGQGAVNLPDGKSGPASEDARRTTFVGPLRTGELTRSRVSTVDDLDTPAGLVALVLALEDVGGGAVGHYGVAPGASRLLPAPDAGR